MEAIHIERLIHLANVLERLPSEKFHYNSWVGSSWAGMPDLSCGTTACAFGWATTIPQFRELGLFLYKDNEGYIYPALREDVEGAPHVLEDLHDEGEEFWGYVTGAAWKIFGLMEEETELLFVPTEDSRDSLSYDGDEPLEAGDKGVDGRISKSSSAKQVARHIREFCERKLKEMRP